MSPVFLGVRHAHARQDAAARLFLWKVTSKTNTVYLLGSIHVGSKEFYPLPAEIEAAFAESKTLAVEVDLTKVDQEAVQGKLLEKGTYPDDDGLRRHVPRETMDKLRDYLAARGLPMEAMEKFRPWALAVTITQLEMQSLGYQPGLGVDKHFIDAAAGRPVVELESADEQVNLLGGFPDKQEAAFLGSTLDSAAKTKDLVAKTMTMWKAGDAAGMYKLLVAKPLRERPDLRPVFAKLFDERNAKMAKKVETFLGGKQPHFVVVGAGHLIGEHGMVRLLEKKGYHVEQVSRAPKPDDPPPERKPALRGYAPAGAWEK